MAKLASNLQHMSTLGTSPPTRVNIVASMQFVCALYGKPCCQSYELRNEKLTIKSLSRSYSQLKTVSHKKCLHITSKNGDKLLLACKFSYVLQRVDEKEIPYPNSHSQRWWHKAVHLKGYWKIWYVAVKHILVNKTAVVLQMNRPAQMTTSVKAHFQDLILIEELTDSIRTWRKCGAPIRKLWRIHSLTVTVTQRLTQCNRVWFILI